MVIKIPLKDRKGDILDYTYVDDEDYENIKHLSFHLFKSDGKKYAICSKPNKRLHHLILGKHEDKNIVIDHINGDGLDNVRSNLRHITISANAQNRNNDKTNHISQYIGLYKTKYNKWKVSISSINYGNLHLGIFETEIEAAKQYDRAAMILYGEMAKTNNLIKYEEVKELKIEDILPKKHIKELPFGIEKVDKKYKAVRQYKNKRHRSKRVLTIKEAVDELYKLNFMILQMEIIEDYNFRNQEIQRNNEGNAIIPVKKKDETLYAIVDAEVWYDLKKYSWSISGNVYVNAWINGKSTRLHHYITGENGSTMKENEVIDHINTNTLDNRKCNLRKCTRQQNSQNNNLDKIVGVKKHKLIYKICIAKNGKKYTTQGMETQECAIVMYNILALHFGYFRLNKINKEEYYIHKDYVFDKIVNIKDWMDDDEFEDIYNKL